MAIIILTFLALLSLLLIGRQRKGIAAFFLGKRREPEGHSARAGEDMENLYPNLNRPAVKELTQVRATGTIAHKNTISDEREEGLYFDEQGSYRLLKKTVETPRKIYLTGWLRGKYWGEMDPDQGKEYEHALFYDFHIYEAEVRLVHVDGCRCITPDKPVCKGLHTEAEGRFHMPADTYFPRHRLPKLLPVTIIDDQREYAVNIYDPRLADIVFVSRLHQTEGREVFGTMEAKITGFLLDFLTEEVRERVYEKDGDEEGNGLVFNNAVPQPVKTGLPTGNTKFNKGYSNTQYWYDDFRTSYWGGWRYQKRYRARAGESCLSSVSGIIGAVIGFSFLIMLLPKAAIILPFIVLPILFRFVPQMIWVWLIRILGLLVLVGLALSFISGLHHPRFSYPPRADAQEQAGERETQYSPIKDSSGRNQVIDTLIGHYRNWSDYDGNCYEGRIWVKRAAWARSSAFKKQLHIVAGKEQQYDEMVFRLKEQDKDKLAGVYQLFDSINAIQRLPPDKFAELIVSFVQDIPYTLVLPEACNAALYSDNFIRKYLNSAGARCDGYEKFGINTPVEFMATLNGDCDTRTLLLYTLLSHYHYDVILLSSEFYNHSLIGINLSYEGTAYTYRDRRYILWETTAANIRPGLLPAEIANLNYWRISLKSQ